MGDWLGELTHWGDAEIAVDMDVPCSVVTSQEQCRPPGHMHGGGWINVHQASFLGQDPNQCSELVDK